MSVTDWFRRLFSPSPSAAGAEDEATLREEYGEDGPHQAGTGAVVTGGVSGFAGLEDAQAAEDELEQFDSPTDPAP
jgi:hypothetical protein